jgi:hypothetical protein
MTEIEMEKISSCDIEEDSWGLVSNTDSVESCEVAQYVYNHDDEEYKWYLPSEDQEYDLDDYRYWAPIKVTTPAEPVVAPAEEFSIPGYKIVNGLVVKV